MNVSLLLLDSNLDMGYFMLTLIIGGIIILGLWMELIVKPKEEKEKRESERDWKEQERLQDLEFQKDFQQLKLTNSPILYSKNLLEQKVSTLSISVPSCNKCGEDLFTVWELNNSTLTIRCNGCKKKFIIRNNDIENDFVKYFNTSFNMFIALLDNDNPYLKEYQNHSFDFLSLRSNFPKCRGIVFESNGEVIESIIDNISSDEPSRRISQKVMDKVWNRDGGKCVKCGSNEKLEFDHIIPFSKGGSNTYRNIQLLCENCNRSKSNNIG
jgi:hypothetical protein